MHIRSIHLPVISFGIVVKLDSVAYTRQTHRKYALKQGHTRWLKLTIDTQTTIGENHSLWNRVNPVEEKSLASKNSKRGKGGERKQTSSDETYRGAPPWKPVSSTKNKL
jgi:hypothetical protein